MFRFRPWRILLSLGAGLALALAFPNYNMPVVGWVSLSGLLFALLGARPDEGALCGFFYGVTFYVFTLPWVYTVMLQYGPVPSWQAAGLLALIVIVLSLYCAAFGLLVAWIAKRSSGLALLAAPFLWVAVEFWRTHVPAIGFPWDLLGYAAARSLAIVQLASLTGIYGLSLLVAAYDALLVWALRQSRSRGLMNRASAVCAGCTLLLLATGALGGRLVPRAQSTSVAHLVQTNLRQSLEYPANWEQLHAGDMAEIEHISIGAAQKQPGLIVWPEVPAPFSLEDAPFEQRATRIAEQSGSDFLLGVVDWKPSPQGLQPYNSAALLDPRGREEFLYDKIHLVPFSEYIPGRRYLFFARSLTGLVGDFRHGERYAVGKLPGGPFSVFICYEAVFPDTVRRFARNGAAVLINISDDGWFGRSDAPAQHLAMARVRAVENRRWLLRDTNNGFTASIDPYGRVVASLPPDVRGELDAPYAFRGDVTLYTRWGDWVAWLSVVVAAVCVAAAWFVTTKG